MITETVLQSPFYDEKGVSLYLSEPLDGYSPHPSVGPVPSRRLILGTLENLQLIENPKNTGEIGKFRLKDFIRLNWGPTKIPVYIVDYHQFALYGWCEAVKEGRVNPGASLRSYDDHADDGVTNLEVLEKEIFQKGDWDLATIVEYVRGLGCWQFIDPAIRMSLVDYFIHIIPRTVPPIVSRRVNNLHGNFTYDTVNMAFYRQYRKNPRLSGIASSRIVSVDLDYFASGSFDASNLDEDIQTIRADMQSAGVITFATSPGFIDQEEALRLTRTILY